MGVESINELFLLWKEEKLGMDRAIGQRRNMRRTHEVRLITMLPVPLEQVYAR